MSFKISNFLILLCCIYLVTSSAHALSSECNNYNCAKEFMKITEKLSFLFEEVDQLKEEIVQSKSEIVQLKVNNNGLKQEVKRSKERENELQNEINSVKNELSESKKKIDLLEKSVSLTKPHLFNRFMGEYSKKKPELTWVVSNVKSKLNATHFELKSDVFPLSAYPFGVEAKLSLEKDSYLYVSLCFKDMSKSGKNLDLKLIPTVYYVIKRQRSGDVIRQANYAFGALLQYDRFHNGRWISPWSEVTNDLMTIEVHVEDPWVTRQAYSHDGSLTWAIDDFRERRAMDKNHMMHFPLSPVFYTAPTGYRVEAMMWPNGAGSFETKGLTAQIVFMTGPYDEDLSPSFLHRTTVTLLHPIDPSKHIVKSVDVDLKDKQWYRIDVATHQEVENLLMSDSLYYHISIVKI